MPQAPRASLPRRRERKAAAALCTETGDGRGSQHCTNSPPAQIQVSKQGIAQHDGLQPHCFLSIMLSSEGLWICLITAATSKWTV